MSNLIELRDRALALAERFVGVRESGGRNRGPQIERWLANVNMEPGQPWCAAFVYSMFAESAAGLGIDNPIPKAASVAKLWAKAPEHMRTDRCNRGAVFIHFTDPDKPWSTGHTGFVYGVDGDFALTVEGNSNDAGNRDGDGVWHQRRPRSYMFGFIDVGREGPIAPPK